MAILSIARLPSTEKLLHLMAFTFGVLICRLRLCSEENRSEHHDCECSTFVDVVMMCTDLKASVEVQGLTFLCRCQGIGGHHGRLIFNDTADTVFGQW